MKSDTGKILLYVALFLLFVTIRLSFILSTGGLLDIEFKTVAIANSAFPFGIIKNSITEEMFMPLYCLLLRFVTIISKNEIFLRIISSAIALVNIAVIINIGKKLLNEYFGIFLGFLFTINKFFLFYTTIVSPYCLNFLVGTLLINCLIMYLQKPKYKNLKNLLILNCIYIFTCTNGILFIGAELLILYRISKNKKIFKKNFQKLFYVTVIGCFTAIPFLLWHYFSISKLLIPLSIHGIGFNLNGLYLMLNEYVSPYSSFIEFENQTKSTLGMLYTFFLNPDRGIIKLLKLIITLFYGSILPLIFLFIFALKSFSKNFKLRIIFIISLINLIFFLLGTIYEFTDLNPVTMSQFFIIIFISLGYGIYLIKDVFMKYIFIFCFVMIQIINPNIESFNIAIEKKYPVNKVMDIFIKEYEVSEKDFIMMPYLGRYGKLYYSKLNFFDFDYNMLKRNGKDDLIKHLSNKKSKTINKNNIKFLLTDFLLERRQNNFLTLYFVDNCLDKTHPQDRVILFIDKLNSKPISKKTIVNFAKYDKYKPNRRKINFRNGNITKNDIKTFYNAVSSKTLYNFLTILSNSFYTSSIVEYKKIDNDFFKLENSSNSIQNAISSSESDYVFIIFKRP